MQAPTPLAPMPKIDVSLSEADLMARVDELADRLAPRLTGDWTAVSILIGATPFTSDLMKALARRDVHPILDVLWLESYRDARESSGRVVVRADVSRPVEGRGMLLIDDVFDTGRTLEFAKHHLLAKGAHGFRARLHRLIDPALCGLQSSGDADAVSPCLLVARTLVMARWRRGFR